MDTHHLVEFEDVFYKGIRSLMEMFCTDDNFRVVPSGSGFDHLGISGRGCFGVGLGDHENMHPNLCVSPTLTTLFVPHSVVVINREDVEYLEKNPLILYITDLDDNANCKLYMSPRTHSMVLLHRMDLVAKMLVDSVEVISDKTGMQRFIVLSDSLTEAFNTHVRQHFLYCRRQWPVDAKIEQSVDTDEVDFLATIHRKETEVCAARKQLALFCPSWPEEACNAFRRKRISGWPSAELMQEASGKGCLLKASNALGDKTSWTFDFTESESVILAMSPCNLRENLKHLTKQFDRIDYEKHVPREIIKCAFMWVLEETCHSSLSNLSEFEECMFLKLRVFFEHGRCPDYFMPGRNLMTGYSSDFQAACLNVLQSVRESCEGTKDLSDVKSQVISADAKVVMLEMKHMFNQTVCVLFTWCHDIMYGVEDMSAAVQRHESTLQRITMADIQSKRKETILKIIKSSLGLAYLNKGLRSFYKKEKRYFFSKSEQFLSECMHMDSTCGRIRMMVFFLKMKRFTDAIDVFKGTLAMQQKHCSTEVLPLKPSLYEDYIWSKLLTGACSLGVIITDVEKEAFPAGLHKHLPLASDCMLSQPDQNLAVLSADFMLHYLYVVAVSQSGELVLKEEEDQVSTSLERMEAHCRIDEQPDRNDKRPAAYLSLLANLYLKLGQRPMTLSLLKKACRQFSGPRNPAYWDLMGLKTERTRRRLFHVGGVVLMGSIVYLALKLY